MGIFRSEAMAHGTLVIPAEHAVPIITALGHDGRLMISDMNAQSMSRPYRRYVQRIDEMERKLRILSTEIAKLPGATIEKGHVAEFLSKDHFLFEGVEESISSLSSQFMRFRENNDELLSQRARLVMERAVCKVAKNVLASGGENPNNRLLEFENSGLSFNSIVGVVAQPDLARLERSVYRSCRGNAFTYVEAIDEEFFDAEGVVEQRHVFVVYFQGTALRDRVDRICQAFGVETCEWPRTADEAANKLVELEEAITDKTRALEAFEAFFFDEVAVLLQPIMVGGNSLVEDWRLFCMQQKIIYSNLNLFEETGATLRANVWFPKDEEAQIRATLRKICSNNVSAFLLADGPYVKIREAPPTFHKTTQFTECFQNMVDTYGVGRYQEANPALLSAITFPFMFGMMYGDIGHGAMVLLAGLFMVIKYDSLKNIDGEVIQLVLYGRYMILLMGIFAVYAGFIYNDLFSLGVDMFGSRWAECEEGVSCWYQCTRNQAGECMTEEFGLINSDAGPYPFGLDPAWKEANNELDFLNSFKMKLAVIFGFVHMMAGIIHKAFNASFYKDKLTMFFEFIPQFIFMAAFVGYMDFLIILKWLTPYDPLSSDPELSRAGPSIISTLIGMCMLKEVGPADQLYSGQQTVERILLLVIVICIPWMLLFKPILAKMAHDKKHKSSAPSARLMEEDYEMLEEGVESAVARPSREMHAADDEQDFEEEFEFGEEFIHQTIETIEFVLGAISNTASYLRLWALSLAHQQLAVVAFQQIMLTIINAVVKEDGGAGNLIISSIAIFLGFGAFSAATTGIILCMDTLECYLHALRLHWVEFQNKFYKADGYRFKPFSFYRNIMGLDQD